MNKDYQEYLQSSQWKEFRKKAFEHYGRRCSKCGTEKDLQVHHKTYVNIFNELLDDVMILCRTHHEEIHNIKPKKTKIKKERKLSKKRLKKLRKIEQHKIRLTKKKDKPKNKRINPRLPSPEAILQKKYERIARQMRVVE